jgi:hypothetical protein
VSRHLGALPIDSAPHARNASTSRDTRDGSIVCGAVRVVWPAPTHPARVVRPSQFAAGLSRCPVLATIATSGPRLRVAAGMCSVYPSTLPPPCRSATPMCPKPAPAQPHQRWTALPRCSSRQLLTDDVDHQEPRPADSAVIFGPVLGQERLYLPCVGGAPGSPPPVSGRPTPPNAIASLAWPLHETGRTAGASSQESMSPRTAPGSPIHRSPAPTSIRRSIRWSTSCATPSSRTVNTTAASGAPGTVSRTIRS